MGWLFTQGFSKKELIADLIKPSKWAGGSMTTVAHCVRGNVLWMVREIYSRYTGHFERFIECDLLGSQKGYGWGYKDMDESMGPYYYSCPLPYLTGTRVLNRGWRKAVREYHAVRTRKMKVDELYPLRGDRTFVLRITSTRPLKGKNIQTGVAYKLRKAQLGERISDPGEEKTSRRVRCKFCKNLVPKATAHRHAGSWVGDECCWDERLRNSE